MVSSQSFVYDGLLQDGQSIRLLTVLPDAGAQEPVKCTLSHATTKEIFTALSYTWGGSVKDQQIRVNDKPFAVGYNLWEFLKRVSVSPDFVTKKFWIDAICINQEDNQEKNYQVAKMGTIYERARDVLIWLCPTVTDQRKLTRDEVLPIRVFEEMSWCLPESDRILLDLDCQPRTTCPMYISVRYVHELMAQHDYWTRLWIVQEFLLNRERTIVYGPLAVSWEVFAAYHEYHKATSRERKRELFNNSLSAWLTSPMNFLSMMLCRWKAIADYIYYERAKFTTKNDLASPLSTGNVTTRSLATLFVSSIGKLAPAALYKVVAWRMDTFMPSLPTMADMLRSRDEENSELRLLSKSAFFLFMQNLAEMRCFDRRDKLFGLTALSGGGYSFPINYDIDIYELYFRTLQIFSDPRDIETEPCVTAPEAIACGLLDVFKIGLSDLARNDARKRSTNCFLSSHMVNQGDNTADRGVSSNTLISTATGRDIEYFFQNFEQCVRMQRDKDLKVFTSCPHCGQKVVFDATTLLKLLELRIACDALIGETGKDELVCVLLCHISPPAIKPNISDTSRNEPYDVYFEHLMLYIDPSSGRPGALLDLKGQASRERLLSSLSIEVLKTHLEYVDKVARSHPPVHTFPC